MLLFSKPDIFMLKIRLWYLLKSMYPPLFVCKRNIDRQTSNFPTVFKMITANYAGTIFQNGITYGLPKSKLAYYLQLLMQK